MPRTQYAPSGDVRIAYQAIGAGPPDLVYVPGWVTNVEVMWEEPTLAGFMRRLASFSRLVTFDKRGVGLSDPIGARLPDIETRVADLEAVMDHAGVEQACLFGHSQGGSTAIRFTVTHPDRVERLILFGVYAKRLYSADYPWAPTEEERRRESQSFESSWDDPVRIAQYYAPSRADDPAYIEWVGRWLRLSASPRAAATLNDASTEIDVTGDLPNIRVPTLLIYRLEDQDVKVEEGRYIASRIPGSRLVELHGVDHFFYAGSTEPILEEIEQFVTGHRVAAEPDRVLTTVLFTDVVESTDTAVELGDRRWRETVHRHNTVVRSCLSQWRGTEVDTAGDGFFATFDAPAHAIRCAQQIVASVRSIGLEVRCGIHTGEVERFEHGVIGVAVNIGARIAELAGPSEVLVSRTVRDLVAGTGLDLTSRGIHDLKGVPGGWELFAAGAAPSSGSPS